MHFRLEVGRFRLAIWREPKPDESEPNPPYTERVPTPQTVWTPEYVGFVQLPDRMKE